MDAWREHGGRLEAACARFGGARADWLDLSTGINPHPWPGAEATSVDWHALPDPEALANLEGAAAAHFGAPATSTCALPGTEIGLRLLGTILSGEAVHVVPSYGTHAEAIPGSRPIGIDALEEAARAGCTILLANPNNPDGRRVEPDRLLALASLARDHGGWLVIDEAFADCREEASLARPDLPLILFRSFGKFFGLAGVRLGFVIGPDAIVVAYRQRLGSWPVSAVAIAIGTAAYRDQTWIGAMRHQLVSDAAALDAVLARHGLASSGTCPLFRLVETRDAGALFTRLAERRILTRPFDYRPDWLRFGLPGSAEALDRLDAALGRG